LRQTSAIFAPIRTKLIYQAAVRITKRLDVNIFGDTAFNDQGVALQHVAVVLFSSNGRGDTI
jgi:hypothetical protein